MKRLGLFLLLAYLLVGCDTTPTPIPIGAVTVVVREVATRTPLVTSTSLPTSQPEDVCPGAPPVQLILNQRGRVLDEDPRPLNMRTAPGTDSDIVGRIEIGKVFNVLDGPECADGYQWFFIEYGTLQGWIAEGDNTSYFVEPFLTG